MKKNRKHRKIIKGIFLFLLLVSLVGLRFWYIKSVDSPKMIGSIYAEKKQVLSQVSGIVDKVFVNENDFVKPKDKIASVDTELLELKVKEIDAKINYTTKQKNLIKMQEDRALEEYITSKKDTEPDQKSFKDKLKNLEEKQHQAKIVDAKIEMYKSEKELIEKQIERKYIFSSFSGQISDINIEIGKPIYKSDYICSIKDNENLWLNVKVNESQLKDLKKNKTLKLEFISYPDQKFQGNIFDISKNEDNLFNLKLSVNHLKNSPDEKSVNLLPGMTAYLKNE
ncbi:MAG: efflux RND transporter periplasmic adaptor subunit [Parachlamydiales bacterium]|nr:efflux RND transporter periplasmic adaptor subunit [Parachlamydiales bacterium]